MKKRFTAAVAAVLLVATAPGVAGAGGNDRGAPFRPGAPGIGDPYYPLAGNGGYDVQHYTLDVRYDPATAYLSGLTTIVATATQNLSSFDLDLVGLNVRWVKVNGVVARFHRDGGELVIEPRHGLRNHVPFTVQVRYDGNPGPIDDPALGQNGWFPTDDGSLVAGQPSGAATWFPVNDHPLDRATYTFKITVPEGLQAVANGFLVDTSTANGWTTWKWNAGTPMASYLTTVDIGEFDIHAYQADGLKFWDAVDPDLYDPLATAHTGTQFLISQQGQQTYKRLMRTIAVPAGNPTLTFWVTRNTELNWDHFFVEAHTPGNDDWTTLPEASGITSGDTGNSCPYWLGLHPFLAHYQTDNGDDTCTPTGTTGAWNAVSGASDGPELWTIDLSAYAGANVEISLSYASDDSVQLPGVFIDDIAVTGGDGNTSFEDDGDVLDGWTVAGAPDGSIPNENDWIVGTDADTPTPPGQIVDASFARQPEILQFLEGYFGPYPFKTAGGIVDDKEGLGFALETQTRPVYAFDFFSDPISADSVVVHENTHQWFGDDLPLAQWSDIWLNEGFATYAEWLWSEHEGLGTVQENFDFFAGFPDDDPFWTLEIGDPGPDHLFEAPVYYRGAMTLHALRLTVGDHDFFKIVKLWASTHSGDNVSTREFVKLAERVSGRKLGWLFHTWLHTTTKPEIPAGTTDDVAVAAARSASVPSAQGAMKRWSLLTR